MPKVSPEYKARLKGRIVQAASKVFRRSGYIAASMDDVAEEVGVSKGTLYLYFPSKVALLREIQANSRQRFLARMDRIMSGGDLARPMVRLFEKELEGVADPAIYYGLLAAASADPELRSALEDDHRADEADLKKFFAHLEATGRIAPGQDLEALVTIVLGLLESAAGRYLLGGDRVRARRALERALRVVLSGTRSRPEGRRRKGTVPAD